MPNSFRLATEGSLKLETDPALSDVFADVDCIKVSKPNFGVLAAMGLTAITSIFVTHGWMWVFDS